MTAIVTITEALETPALRITEGGDLKSFTEFTKALSQARPGDWVVHPYKDPESGHLMLKVIHVLAKSW